MCVATVNYPLPAELGLLAALPAGARLRSAPRARLLLLSEVSRRLPLDSPRFTNKPPPLFVPLFVPQHDPIYYYLAG